MSDPAIFAFAPATLLLGGLALVYAALYAGVALRMAVDAVVDWWRKRHALWVPR
jgi:hypothetical protein